MSQIRWNILVSKDIDQSPRTFFARQDGGKEDISRFIKNAVRPDILALNAGQVKAANAGLSESELSAIVDEAVQWASSCSRWQT